MHSSCTTEVESGVCKGFDLSVNLKMLCEILEANAGYHHGGERDTDRTQTC